MNYRDRIDLETRLNYLKKNYYMLAILAKGEKNYPDLGLLGNVVTRKDMSRDSDIVFYLRSISTDSDFFVVNNIDQDLFVGYNKHSFSNDMQNFLLGMDFDAYSIDRKVEILEEKLSNKILLIKPKIVSDENQNKFIKLFYIEDFEDFNGISEFSSIEELKNEEIIPLPGVDGSNDEFEQKLFNKEVITFSDYNIMELELDKIIVGDYIYFDPELNWEITQHNKCLNKAPENIKKIKIPEDFNENIIYKGKGNYIFLPVNYYNQLDKIEGEHLEAKIIVNNGRDEVNNQAGATKEENLLVTSIENNISSNKYELEFLKQLKLNALSENLYYNEEDLYNLHVSIKTSPLTIISGMSGTGKTKMAELYAKTLSLKIDEECIIIPISPSYTEPGDVLGYLNTMSGIYTPAETALVDLLRKAADNPEQIYMVIFDEMNLSQVEHWFSPFISLLELKEENRRLKLFNKNSVCQNGYKSEIHIGHNVVFIGTVNIDETTKEFSDRLLDRANVIIPDKCSFIKIKDSLDEINTTNNMTTKFSPKINLFNNWRNEPINPIGILEREELALLDKLHQVMNKIDSQKGVSFRILDNIAKYIENIPSNEKGELLITRDRAFDLQIKQRVLTKLKGHQQQYGSLIGSYDHNDDEIYDSSIYDILTSEEARKVSKFESSIQELIRKAKEMYFNGYAT
ncbi:MAG: McrB family protein [bacterium]